MTQNQYVPTPEEQPVMTATPRRLFKIGLPRNNRPSERRFPLTPEGAKMLIDQGFEIIMEKGAPQTIHYSDAAYERNGVRVGTRAEAFGCDVVIYLPSLEPEDIRLMRRGAMLVTLISLASWSREGLRQLLQQSILTLDLDLVEEESGNRPFADILAEIDGRAAMARAASFMADSVHGKGILLGGVAGIVPCEVTVIGAGIAGVAAAQSAAGQGALVRMFDHDVYRLRRAARFLGQGVVTSALHPRVLGNALRTADVIIYTGVTPAVKFDREDVETMKRGVIIFDLTADCGHAFPSLPTVDLAVASPLDVSPTEATRACYVNAGSAVARTAAMALSNTFITMLRQIVDCEGAVNAIRMVPGLQRAVVTFLGKPVHRLVAEKAGERHVDINLYLTLS